MIKKKSLRITRVWKPSYKIFLLPVGFFLYVREKKKKFFYLYTINFYVYRYKRNKCLFTSARFSSHLCVQPSSLVSPYTFFLSFSLSQFELKYATYSNVLTMCVGIYYSELSVRTTVFLFLKIAVFFFLNILCIHKTHMSKFAKHLTLLPTYISLSVCGIFFLK